MRKLAFILLLTTAITSRSPAQTTEAGITARLMNRPLYLRGFWSDDTLRFDSTGDLEGHAKPESFTLSGFDLETTHLAGDKLILEGRRVGLEFDNGQPIRVPLEARKRWHHKDVVVHIEIAASPGGDYGPALDAIFANGLAELVPSLPFYWQNFAAKNFLPAQSPAAQTPQSPQQPRGLFHIGGDVKAPILLYSVKPKFSDAVRNLRYSGDAIVNLWVTADGKPAHLSIFHPIGMGLDEEALAAVSQYRFDPATKNGTPVTVELNVAVNFQTY